MAFVRSKKTPKGKVYYQLVRNYREQGVHRQKVLAHLGTHDTLEGAIEHKKQEEADLRVAADTWSEKAESRKKYLLATYGAELGNAIPDEWRAEFRWRDLDREYYREYWQHWDMDQEERLRWIKSWTHKWEMYERILYYYEALGWARRARRKEQ